MRDINYLGFSFGRSNDKCQFYLHEETFKKLKTKIRELTSRSNGWGYDYRKLCLHRYIHDWSNYFRLAGYKNKLKELDGWVRRRIRMCIGNAGRNPSPGMRISGNVA